MLDKSILEIMNTAYQPSAHMRAHIRARICSGPVFIKKDGQLVFSREKTKEAYDKMYNLFLKND